MHISSIGLKCYYSQRISRELTEKILFHEICASWKQMLGINVKVLLSIKKWLPTQSMISSCFENSKYPWWSHFNIEFSWQYKLSWRTAFLIVIHFSAHYERNSFILNENLHYSESLNIYQCHWSRTKKEAFICSTLF